MAIGTQNDFSMRSGDSRLLQVTINDDAGSPLDITGASVIWALSKKATDTVSPKGAAVLTKDSTGTVAATTWLPNQLYGGGDSIVSDGSDWTYAGLGEELSGTTAPNGGASLGGQPFIDGACIWSYVGEASGLPGDIVITTPLSGVCSITLSPADTDALSGEYYHELQLTTASGEISTVLYVQVTIAKDLI